MTKHTWRVISVSGIVLAGLACAVLSSGTEPTLSSQNTGMADPAALINAFDRYMAGLPAAGGSQILTMSLVALRGLTSEAMNAGGNVRINFADGSVLSQVRGMPLDGAFDLWLVDNRPAPGHTTMAEPQDVLLRVGAPSRYREPCTGSRSHSALTASRPSFRTARSWCGPIRAP